MELGLECKLFVSNIVLTWRDESDTLQSVGDASVVKGSTVEDWEYKLLTSVEEHNGCWVVLHICWGVEVQSASSGAGGWEPDRVL